MKVMVCLKQVPDAGEGEAFLQQVGEEVQVACDDWVLNEWDGFAVEAAVHLIEEHGGESMAVSIGDEAVEGVLRRALAMGVDQAWRLQPDSNSADDSMRLAHSLMGAALTWKPDLIICGAMASDSGNGLVPGILAGKLQWPFVALATGLKWDGKSFLVRHEIHQGMESLEKIGAPLVVSAQSGLNQPRYVSIRGIRRVAKREIPMKNMADLSLSPLQNHVELVDLKRRFPPSGAHAEILQGSPQEQISQVIQRMREQGVFTS
ncbi:MAG: hypothetical protein DWQ01_01010 [Planctomycetota bacterium]|nr:MAG: hypothetical protein DWQ01_01010 [Planctomycetota bacterium]